MADVKTVSVKEVMAALGMTAGDFMKEWKDLPEDYKAWYKEEAAKAL